MRVLLPRGAAPRPTMIAGLRRHAAAATKVTASTRFPRYPATRWTENTPARSPASSHAFEARPPATRTSAAAAPPTATPSAEASPAVTAAALSESVPPSAAASAGAPGRLPTVESPSLAPTRVHQR